MKILQYPKLSVRINQTSELIIIKSQWRYNKQYKSEYSVQNEHGIFEGITIETI
jgi:hypothetical protein